MKFRIMLHYIRVCTVCQDKTNLQGKKYNYYFEIIFGNSNVPKRLAFIAIPPQFDYFDAWYCLCSMIGISMQFKNIVEVVNDFAIVWYAVFLFSCRVDILQNAVTYHRSAHADTGQAVAIMQILYLL